MDAYEAISLPESSISGKKYFSLAEANRSLILVRRIVADIVREYRQVRKLHEACRSLDSHGQGAPAAEARQRYVSLTDRLSGLKEELEKVGCELKDYRLGLVDFPGRLDGREICFCWKLGEDFVESWHELSAGYAGRQPVSSLGE
jgi:hypothetical protein